MVEMNSIIFKKQSIVAFLFVTFLTCIIWILCVHNGNFNSGKMILEFMMPVQGNNTVVHQSRPNTDWSTIAQLCSLPEIQHMMHKPFSRPQYFLFNKTRVCYCVVPKAASTSAMRSILAAEYPENATYFNSLAGSKIHVIKEIRQAKSSSGTCADGSDMSFFVTRDPYQRLFSAYIDKVFLEKFKRIANTIAWNNLSEVQRRAGWSAESNTSLVCDVTNATFEQFLSYIVTQGRLDPHFAPITSLCNPCEHKFDLIMKQEELFSYEPELLKHLYKGRQRQKDAAQIKDYSGFDGIRQTASSFYSARNLYSRKYCELTSRGRNDVNRRLWEALKILGSIDDRLAFNNSLFGLPPLYRSGDYFADTLVDNLQKANIHPLSYESREEQRMWYLQEAYRSVSANILQQIQKTYMMDFIMFGYDINPP